jgi:single-strand DNA-binding protein
MSNAISFMGYCCGDAKVKNINDNTVLEVTVANKVGYGDKQITNWMRVSYWKNAEKMLELCSKGQQVFVSGELANNEYTAQDGTKKSYLGIRANILDIAGKKATDSDSNIKVHNPPETSSNYDYDDIPF